MSSTQTYTPPALTGKYFCYGWHIVGLDGTTERLKEAEVIGQTYSCPDRLPRPSRKLRHQNFEAYCRAMNLTGLVKCCSPRGMHASRRLRHAFSYNSTNQLRIRRVRLEWNSPQEYDIKHDKLATRWRTPLFEVEPYTFTLGYQKLLESLLPTGDPTQAQKAIDLIQQALGEIAQYKRLRPRVLIRDLQESMMEIKAASQDSPLRERRHAYSYPEPDTSRFARLAAGYLQGYRHNLRNKVNNYQPLIDRLGEIIEALGQDASDSLNWNLLQELNHIALHGKGGDSFLLWRYTSEEQLLSQWAPEGYFEPAEVLPRRVRQEFNRQDKNFRTRAGGPVLLSHFEPTPQKGEENP